MKYAKAIYGALVAALIAGGGALAPWLANGASLGDISALGWLTAALAFLGALGAVGGVVAGVTNAPPAVESDAA